MKFTSFVFLSLAIALLAGSPAFAARLVYPGAAPCSGTLQGCIDGAQSGDTILLAGNADEDLTIYNKSLTILPVAGLPAPIIGGSSVHHVQVQMDSGTFRVMLNQLVLYNTDVSVIMSGGTGHRFTLANSLVITGTRSITVSSWVTSRINILHNSISTNGADLYGINMTTYGESASSAIDTDISGNEFTGSGYANVISLDMRGQGMVDAAVRSNLIHNTGTGIWGNPAAIGLTTLEQVQSDFRIVNNTLDNVGLSYGIWVAQASSTSATNVDVYNNIISNSSGGVRYPSFNANLTIHTDYNDFYNNTGGNYEQGYPIGSHNYAYNPAYVDAAQDNYELSSTSGCINTGDNTASLPIYDNYDKPRVIDNTVDIGAAEAPSNYWTGDHVLFMDQFNDGTINSSYLYKNNWYEDWENLVAVPTKAGTFYANPVFAGCTLCSFQATVRSAGTLNPLNPSRVFLYSFYANRANALEVLFKPDTGKYILRQRVDGKIVRKTKTYLNYLPEQEYHVRTEYDGSNFNLYVDGTKVLTMPAVGTPFGSFGMKVKGTEAYLNGVYAYE